LLSILKQRIADKDILNLIWKFLKAGVMEDGLFARTETGVPQGGVISPLLANVYLNEFDKWAEAKWNILSYEKAKRRRAGQGNYRLIRYADDFVVMSNDGIAGVQQAK
jgi:retron-type reverse transcriptase